MLFSHCSRTRAGQIRIRRLCHLCLLPLSSDFHHCIPLSPAVLNPGSSAGLKQPLSRPAAFQDHWENPVDSHAGKEPPGPGADEPSQLPAATAGRLPLISPAVRALLLPDSRSGCIWVRRGLAVQYQLGL